MGGPAAENVDGPGVLVLERQAHAPTQEQSRGRVGLGRDGGVVVLGRVVQPLGIQGQDRRRDQRRETDTLGMGLPPGLGGLENPLDQLLVAGQRAVVGGQLVEPAQVGDRLAEQVEQVVVAPVLPVDSRPARGTPRWKATAPSTRGRSPRLDPPASP